MWLLILFWCPLILSPSPFIYGKEWEKGAEIAAIDSDRGMA